MLALSHWVQPRGPFPDVSKFDAQSVLEATGIVLRYLFQGGSLYGPQFSSSSWPSSFLWWGTMFLVSTLSVLGVLFGRGRVVGLAIFVGGVAMGGMALSAVGVPALNGYWGSIVLVLYCPPAVAYIAVGIYAFIVGAKEW
jgi:hypothetical protein